MLASAAFAQYPPPPNELALALGALRDQSLAQTDLAVVGALSWDWDEMGRSALVLEAELAATSEAEPCRVVSNAARMGNPIFDWDLVGRGISGVHLGSHFDTDGFDTGRRYLYSFRYSFSEDAAAPVPEPSTLLLVGGALTGAAIRRRRSRSTGQVAV